MAGSARSHTSGCTRFGLRLAFTFVLTFPPRSSTPRTSALPFLLWPIFPSFNLEACEFRTFASLQLLIR
jgi:hypothetical protein